MNKNSGIIFDIQHTSLHDGPGIRTTVFLKGCPLKCLWCHNPESIEPAPQLSFDYSRCLSCLTCVLFCDYNAHLSIDGQHQWTPAACTACGLCVDHCPAGALEMIGRQMTVDDVMAEVIIDQPFFEASGGGMTLSGGEPMLQFSFTHALLKTAKNKNLHTCLETCGQAPWHQFQAILEDVDIFLYDFKTAFSTEHARLTGQSNVRIMTNLDRLYHTGAKIILRCPLIPGLNDSREHLDQIIRLCHQYPHLLGIEIMPYHELGRSKSKQIGRQIPLGQISTADEGQKRTWKAYLAGQGCENIRMA